MLRTNDFLEKLHTEDPVELETVLTHFTRLCLSLAPEPFKPSRGFGNSSFSGFLVHTELFFQSNVVSHAPPPPSSCSLLIFLFLGFSVLQFLRAAFLFTSLFTFSHVVASLHFRIIIRMFEFTFMVLSFRRLKTHLDVS